MNHLLSLGSSFVTLTFILWISELVFQKQFLPKQNSIYCAGLVVMLIVGLITSNFIGVIIAGFCLYSNYGGSRFFRK